MLGTIHKTAEEIDALIRENAWFDFDVATYDGRDLVIHGSTDFSYYHQLEVRFHNVFFASAYFMNWKSDTTKPVFIIPENSEAYKLNYQLEIEQGNNLFVFKIEDSKNEVIIAAKSISYNTDIVLYYHKDDLLLGQRLALGVVKPTQ